MPTKQQDENQPKSDSPQRKQLTAIIGTHVLHKLGKPSGSHWVQVRRLWGDYFRVNILIGVDIVSAKVANSYFLKVDGDGNIVGSTPDITKRY